MIIWRNRPWVQKAGLNDFRRIVSTSKGLKAATEWVIQRGILGQSTLAREQLFGAA